MATVILTRRATPGVPAQTITLENRTLSVHDHDGTGLRQIQLDDVLIREIGDRADAAARAGERIGTTGYIDPEALFQMSIHDPRGQITFATSFSQVESLGPKLRELVKDLLERGASL